MERHLNLVIDPLSRREKRVLPRFPYTFLLFKESCQKLTFAIVDVSHTGMQLLLKNGELKLSVGEILNGTLCWNQNSHTLQSTIKWIVHTDHETRLGVAFLPESIEKIATLLDIERLTLSVRPLHHENELVNFPDNLKYWLRADGPCELFVWRHPHGEFARFQVIILDQFIEWEDGLGIKTGKIKSIRDVETPLSSQDELYFDCDDEMAPERVCLANRFISAINPSFLSAECTEFLKLKLTL